MKHSNPNAFPYGYGTDRYERAESGMTLRDYFAAKAMQAMISNPNIVRPDIDGSKETEHLAQFSKVAYKYADAMLKQREV